MEVEKLLSEEMSKITMAVKGGHVDCTLIQQVALSLRTIADELHKDYTKTPWKHIDSGRFLKP